MTDFALQDLVTPVSRQEAEQSIYDVLGIVGVNTTAWKPGAAVRVLIAGSAVVLSALSQLQAKIARSGFLQFSEGDWLTLVASYVYGVDRIEATFAVGELTLTNAGGGVYSFDPDDLVFLNPAASPPATYRNTAAVSIGALAPAVKVAIRATEAGKGSNAAPGEIDTMVTTVIGVTCSNAAQLTGADAESDAALRNRCSEKLGSLSPMGPWDAYSFAARNAKREDGTNVGVTRIRITKDGYGNVGVTVAGVDGAILGDVNDPTTDLGIARVAIDQWATPVGVTAIVASAVNHGIAITYAAWVYESDRTDAEIEALIASATEAFLRARPVGGDVIGSPPGKMFANALRSAIIGAATEVFNASITVPAGDVTLAANECAVSDGPPVATIHRVAAPEGFGGSINA